jgi:hypothetical protein
LVIVIRIIAVEEDPAGRPAGSAPFPKRRRVNAESVPIRSVAAILGRDVVSIGNKAFNLE